MKLGDSEAINNEIISFYKSFMGAAIVYTSVLSKTIMKRSPQVALCAEVTNEEIYVGLHSIEDDKAPEVDVYNTKLFKKKLVK